MTKGFKKLAYRAARRGEIQWDPEGITGWLQAGLMVVLGILVLLGTYLFI